MIIVSETKDDRLLAVLNEQVQTFHHVLQPTVFKPYDRESIAEFFKSVLTKEGSVAYIAVENETVLGYALLFTMNFPENPFQYSRKLILLDQLLVVEEYRGTGVGKRLLDAVISFAREKEIDLIELNHWTGNDAARTFFGKHGFTYYNEKMWRRLE